MEGSKARTSSSRNQWKIRPSCTSRTLRRRKKRQIHTRARAHTHTHTYIAYHTNIDTIHTYIHTIHTYTHTYIHTYMNAYIYTLTLVAMHMHTYIIHTHMVIYACTHMIPHTSHIISLLLSCYDHAHMQFASVPCGHACTICTSHIHDL